MRRTSPNLQVENIYRRYARVRLDAIVECYDLISYHGGSDALVIMENYIKRHGATAFRDKDEAMLGITKLRRPINHISVGTSRGL